MTLCIAIMDAKDILDAIRTALKPVKEQKKDVISVEALENYLNDLEKGIKLSNDALQRQQEHGLAVFQAENDRNIAQAQIETSHALEMFRSVITAGQSALKASMIINGGAIVALLAFIGHVGDKISNIQPLLASSIWLFCLGVLASAVASGFTYLSQLAYSNPKSIKFGIPLHIFTVLLVIGSYVLFASGCFGTLETFNHSATTEPLPK